MKETVNRPIAFDRSGIEDHQLIELYLAMLHPRLIEEKMLILLRQGRISKWFSGIGQEAISIGCTLSLHPDEMIFPMHRNLGVFTSRNVPMERLFAQWQGKISGFTKGRDRSFHFGTMDYNIAGHDFPPGTATFTFGWCRLGLHSKRATKGEFGIHRGRWYQ